MPLIATFPPRLYSWTRILKLCKAIYLRSAGRKMLLTLGSPSLHPFGISTSSVVG